MAAKAQRDQSSAVEQWLQFVEVAVWSLEPHFNGLSTKYGSLRRFEGFEQMLQAITLANISVRGGVAARNFVQRNPWNSGCSRTESGPAPRTTSQCTSKVLPPFNPQDLPRRSVERPKPAYNNHHILPQ
ncbi:hypothetical protein PanWU01x14_217820 [Parasponia andersonii]|uniref:Uncharacterized protein n=1 Tax=Parasponia andersonii TaxID=3476 RepID=A0A2P5BQY5_PARAD|nr:hypothetical protein PanWU01x14_217820 [Parasponia andersonii]